MIVKTTDEYEKEIERLKETLNILEKKEKQRGHLYAVAINGLRMCSKLEFSQEVAVTTLEMIEEMESCQV